MSTATKVSEATYLHPLPLPDVVHTREAQLPPPEVVTGGRCFCCGMEVKHRFLLEESLPLSLIAEAAEDSLTRLERAQDVLRREQSRPPSAVIDEQEKYRKALKAAEMGVQHASLAARRLALRHIPMKSIAESGDLSPDEYAELQLLSPPFHLCYICHAWHALNGYAAAQGTLVWLPDLHPRSVVALNRKALLAIFSNTPVIVREGRKVLTELLRHRLPLEDRFRSWRPADFADALRRFPPSQRGELRHNMSGVALILTPDSFPDRDYIS